MRANCSSSSACPANSSEEELPVGLDAHGNLELVFTVVSAVMMGLLMFSLGCSVEVRKLWAHVRRPWGIAVGLLCQFGLMPLTAYLLAISFSLKPVQAVAVLIMGCCPGGTISNIFTFWVDGDMDLSISMTTCSTVAALGLMPLCLYLYTWSWKLEQNLTIPYQNIGITLACLIVPVAFGICVNYRWPKQSKIILKSWQRCRTISLETGAQNIQMCVTMLQLSFTAKQLVQMLTFPLAYGLFQLLDGFLIVAAYQLYKRRGKNKHRKENPEFTEACHKTSTSPKETRAFLEVNEEAGVTPRRSGPQDS
ncbi:PREDICTED: solute carrier family 10 member 6 isoform X3 [Condylura cristata]|uniref:solute carrier family 10 member 6 isoform X3 n=1 Tax=Condylura cristata TaxID=143302 RepID=UPI000642CC4D|nr:PREDICTED: solute carrier family 10 member 6 isoform X3 [Condylura cristata]